MPSISPHVQIQTLGRCCPGRDYSRIRVSFCLLWSLMDVCHMGLIVPAVNLHLHSTQEPQCKSCWEFSSYIYIQLCNYMFVCSVVSEANMCSYIIFKSMTCTVIWKCIWNRVISACCLHILIKYPSGLCSQREFDLMIKINFQMSISVN